MNVGKLVIAAILYLILAGGFVYICFHVIAWFLARIFGSSHEDDYYEEDYDNCYDDEDDSYYEDEYH